MKRKTLSLLIVSMVLSAAVMAAGEEMRMELMQEIEDTNKSLSSNIALNNKQASTTDAKELTRMFAEVEAHFDGKGDAKNAVDLARQSKVLATDIVGLVDKGDFAAASAASTDLSRTCRTCHTFYKKE